MTDDPADKSLLDRLQALRGSAPSAALRSTPTTKISIDPIERRRTPTREDALAARLKSLRDRDSTSPSTAKSTPSKITIPYASSPPAPSGQAQVSAPSNGPKPEAPEEEDIDAIFQTDDQTLEELLGDVAPDEGFQANQEVDDAKVKALLEELAQSIPKDDDDKDDGEKEAEIVDSDDSDDEGMKRKVDDVLARFRDELEIEASHKEEDEDKEDQEDEKDPTSDTTPQDPDKPIPSTESDPSFSLPDLPQDLVDLPPPPSTTARARSTDLSDITARMAALRASSPSLNLPDVPREAPSKSRSKQVNRLTSRTNYTDDDVDSWCTVCLEDATLRCLGCDDDVYCTRCWREMHVGPAAGFDEQSHKAVQFTRDKKNEKRKIAVGA